MEAGNSFSLLESWGEWFSAVKYQKRKHLLLLCNQKNPVMYANYLN